MVEIPLRSVRLFFLAFSNLELSTHPDLHALLIDEEKNNQDIDPNSKVIRIAIPHTYIYKIP